MPQSGQRFEKGKMRADRRLQKLVPKARTKKELAQRKADEEQLAAIRKEYLDYVHEWLVENEHRVEAYMTVWQCKNRAPRAIAV